jgi:AbrB family looped-hinge helix DNA binding protein
LIGMKTRLTIDAAGRVVLPQPVRKQFHLTRGSLLDIEIERDAIILRPRSHEATLVEEKGLLVHEGEPTGDLLFAVEVARRQRDRDLSGPVGE